jgi:hypothetical protein
VGFLLSSCIFTAESEATSEILGKHLVCEPSSIVKINCPDSESTCLLVGDNEIKKSLFLYSIDAEKLNADTQKELTAKDWEISDIEGMANLDKDRVIVLGSYSRNSDCEIKKNRRRFSQVKVLKDKLKPIGEVIESPEIESKILFDDLDFNSNKIFQAVSKAIDSAERSANLAQGNEEACEKTPGFNAEGAVNISNTLSRPNLWIGLRSPLVSIDKKNYAILLHLKNLDRYQFDEVALLNLEGRGIRELILDGDTIWGIAGGPEDNTDNFALWQFPLEELKANGMIEPKIDRSLPASSEGLAIVNSTAYVSIDGDRGESNSNCKVPGKFIEFQINN